MNICNEHGGTLDTVYVIHDNKQCPVCRLQADSRTFWERILVLQRRVRELEPIQQSMIGKR